VRHNLPGVWLFVSFCANASFGQGLTPATPAKKYIRLNGSVVAIENAPPAAPVISISSPAAGATVAGSSVAVGVSFARAITSVQLKVDGANVGAPATTAPYGLTFDATVLSNGAHSLPAVAVGPGGTTATARSGFYHPPFLNPNPPTRNGWRPMGRVNQTFQITVPCS
jgi:hypothetical protein